MDASGGGGRPPLAELADLVARARARGPAALGPGGLERLPRLARHAASRLAELETTGRDPARRAALAALVHAAQGLLAAPRPRAAPRALARFLLDEAPRAVRAEWRLLLALAVVFYGLAAAAWWGVARDLELAFSLFDARAVAVEIDQLRDTAAGEPFRGNFTFDESESSQAAGKIFANNARVALLFFAAGLVPPLFAWMLGQNGLMLGTYLGVADHWDQAGSIASILVCHGAIELQMILLAGAAGLVLARGALLPGPYTRRHALRHESRRAWALAAPTVPWLLLAGLIEGFVSPHAEPETRLTVAAASTLALATWLLVPTALERTTPNEPHAPRPETLIGAERARRMAGPRGARD